MIRWLLYRFIPYFTVVLLLLGGGLALTTETGLRVIWSQLVAPRLPPGLQIEDVGGRLIHRIQVRGLSWRGEDGLEVDLDTAWVQWRLSSLLRGRIQVEDIVVLSLGIKLAPATKGPAETQPRGELPAQLPDLPNVQLDRFLLRDFSLRDANDKAILNLDQARLHASLKNQTLDLQLEELLTRQWSRWQLQARAQILPESLTLERLRLDQLSGGQPISLRARADCDWPQLDCHAQLNWNDLQWPLNQGRWRSARGQADLAWVARLPSARLSLSFAGEALPEGTLDAQIDTNDQGHILVNAGIQSTPATLQLDGEFAPGTQQLSLTAQARDLDLGYWRAELPSQIGGELQLAARLGEQPRATIKRMRLKGDLRDFPFVLSGHGSWQPALSQLDDFTLKIGRNQIKGQARIDTELKADLRADLPNLAVLYPGLNGNAQLGLTLSGKTGAPRLRWQLTGRELAFNALEIASLDSNGRLGLEPDDAVKLAVTLQEFRLPGAQFDALEVGLDGRWNGLNLRADIAESRGGLSGRWTGQIDPRTAQVQLESQRWDLQLGQQTWALEQPATLGYRNGAFDLARHCWRGPEQARACAQSAFDGQQLSADATLNQLDMALLNAFLPRTSRIAGELDLALAIAPSPLTALDSTLRIDTSPIVLDTEGPDDQRVTVLAMEAGRLEVQGIGPAFEGNLDFAVRGGGGLQGAIALEDGQLDGQLGLKLASLDFLPALSPEILSIQGGVDGQLRVQGEPGAPVLRGKLTLNASQIGLATPGITLGHVRAEVRGDGEQDVHLAIDAQSGGGTLKLTGDYAWAGDQAGLRAKIQGDSFLASDTRQARVRISPDLSLTLQNRDLQLDGRLLVPKARIEPQGLAAEGGIAPDADQVILGEEDQSKNVLRVTSTVTLAMGKEVSFQGFGLSTRIEGRLRTELRPGQVTTGTGELQLRDGQYKAYGQDLTIERGRLIFSGGAVTSPGLDMRAYRKPKPEILVGVEVRGPLDKPSFTLYSEPPMRETDQLSYLVLGRAAESQSEQDEAAINNAALALGLKGGDFLAKRFKGKLGLDDVRIGAQPGQDAQQAALVLGKYLTPEIYVSYGIGLFEPIYTFRLRYELSSKWTLQTESGVESGGDIFYTIER